MSSCEDLETYKKIAGENGKYLGERAQSEQLLAEKNESKNYRHQNLHRYRKKQQSPQKQ